MSMIRKIIEETNLDVELDVLELARFLAVTLTPEEIKREGVEDIAHTLKAEVESAPKITDQEITGGDQFRNERSKLNPPKREPTNRRKRRC